MGEVARRLRALGVEDAERKSYTIARAALHFGVPEAHAEAARARREAEFIRRSTEHQLIALPALRYALVMYATGLQDGGAFAQQTLQNTADTAYRRGSGDTI